MLGSHLSIGEQAELRLIPLVSWKQPRPPAEFLLEKLPPEQFSVNSCWTGAYHLLPPSLEDVSGCLV